MSARDEGESRNALLASWVVILIQFTLFLLIGVLLFVYYGDMHLAHPPLDRTDRIYPEFIWHNLPPGLAGLLIAAILAAAMANLSAALNSLSSTTVVDFLRARSRRDERAAFHATGQAGDGGVGRRAAAPSPLWPEECRNRCWRPA